jgi:hypothetical protein
VLDELNNTYGIFSAIAGRKCKGYAKRKQYGKYKTDDFFCFHGWSLLFERNILLQAVAWKIHGKIHNQRIKKKNSAPSA